MSLIQCHTRLTNLSRLCSGLNKQSLNTNLVIVIDNNECMHTSHQHISSTSKLHTTAASKLACEHKSAQVSSLQNVKLHDLGSWQIHSKHTPTQTCGGVRLSCLMLDCIAWTMWMMFCMFKSSSQTGSKANMSSVSSRMLLCQSNPSKSMNLGTEDFWMEAGLHRVFAVSDQPKANTLLTWAAHPCQEVDNIPHAYPSLPCSALWLLATVEVWLCTASPAWAFHLQGMQARVLRAALHSIGIVSKQAWPPSQHAKSIPQTHAHDTHKKLLKLACVIQWYACNLHGHSLWFWSRANARMQ